MKGLSIFLVFILGVVPIVHAGNHGAKLSCISELSGQYEVVTFVGAANADEARRMLNLPSYGYYFGPSCLEQNTDRVGGDLGQGFDLESADARLCKSACDAKPQCKAWTYVKPNTIQGSNPRCWLKGSVPGARNNSCCISGIR